MKNPQNPYHFLDTFCLRTPLFSLNFYKKLFYKSKIEFEDLKNIWKDRSIKEALFLASPELYTQLNLLFKRKPAKRDHRIKQAFLKYLIRLSTRCTPFGLFAGVTTGNLNKETHIELTSKNQYSRVTKFDTNYLSSLFNYISNIDTIKDQLLFYPNTSFYKITNQYRYVEYEIQNKKRLYSIESVEATEYLKKTISNCKNGKTIKVLAEKMIEDDISFEEAKAYIEVLVDNQILMNELEINVTGNDIFSELIKRLKTLHSTEKLIQTLELLQTKLNKLDRNIGNQNEQYFKIIELIKKLKVPFESKYLYQTDLFSKTKRNDLNIKHAYTIKKMLPLFNKISLFKKNKRLELFKKAYLERYEAREMPLAKVLDIESGIGYIQDKNISNTTPFLEDVKPKIKKREGEEISLFTEPDTIIFNKLRKSQEKKEYILELTDKDFESVKSDWNYIPDTLSAFAEIIKINNQETLVLRGLSANAGNLLARFAYGNNDLLKHLKKITSIEQKIQSNKIVAEIVHLPEARTGNILKRPHIRDYEIPYLAKSTLPKERQISIEDLWISIKNNTIILKSKRLNQEVLPKLTNAHNYKLKSLPIYYFLCDLQNQNIKPYIGFWWHELAEKYNFLPRVVYKNSILSKARWILLKENIQLFMKAYNEGEKLLSLIKEWRTSFSIPKYVQLTESDNALLIDLEHLESVQLLLTTVKNKEKCRLEEFLFSEDTLVKRNKKQFTNECIFTFYNEQKLNSIN